MKTIKLMVLGLCLPFLGTAQTTTPALRINEAYMSIGGINSMGAGLSQGTYEKLASNSLLLAEDYGNYFSYYGSGNFKAGIGLQFRNKEKSGFRNHMELRLGVAYSGYNGYSSYNNNRTYTPYDTLVSQQTGSEYYIDSVSVEYASVRHTFDLLSFDASLIFRTNSEARWSLYGGLGASFGTSLYANTYVSNGLYSYLTGATTGGSYQTHSSTDGDYETYSNSSNSSFTVYVPVGLDFRVANNNQFFNKLHFYTEVTPSFSLRNINSYETIKSPAIGINFGAYYRF